MHSKTGERDFGALLLLMLRTWLQLKKHEQKLGQDMHRSWVRASCPKRPAVMGPGERAQVSTSYIYRVPDDQPNAIFHWLPELAKWGSTPESPVPNLEPPHS